MSFDEEPPTYEDELAENCRKLLADRDLWRWRFEELLKRLEPGEEPDKLDDKYDDDQHYVLQYGTFGVDCALYEQRTSIHAAALEIAVATPKENE